MRFMDTRRASFDGDVSPAASSEFSDAARRNTEAAITSAAAAVRDLRAMIISRGTCISCFKTVGAPTSPTAACSRNKKEQQKDRGLRGYARINTDGTNEHIRAYPRNPRLNSSFLTFRKIVRLHLIFRHGVLDVNRRRIAGIRTRMRLTPATQIAKPAD